MGGVPIQGGVPVRGCTYPEVPARGCTCLGGGGGGGVAAQLLPLPLNRMTDRRV